MFGNPNWFQKKSVGWGLRPVVWKGWLYALAWAGVICVPFVALVATTKVFEALIWGVIMMAALLWDVRQVMRRIDSPSEPVTAAARGQADTSEESERDLLIIDEDTQPDPERFATRSFDLHVRR